MRSPPSRGGSEKGDHVEQHTACHVGFLGVGMIKVVAGAADTDFGKVVPDKRYKDETRAAQIQQDGLEIRAGCGSSIGRQGSKCACACVY